jgi:hypothetical protein
MRVLRRSISKIIYYPGYRVMATESNAALSVGSRQYFHLDESIGFTICKRTISELFRSPAQFISMIESECTIRRAENFPADRFKIVFRIGF